MRKIDGEDVAEVIARRHVHFTPTAVSRLRQTADFFALPTEKQFGCGIHRVTQKGAPAVRNDCIAVNANRRPFRWTNSAGITLSCLRILGTAERRIEIGKTSESG